jgi:hypothetical protein
MSDDSIIICKPSCLFPLATGLKTGCAMVSSERHMPAVKSVHFFLIMQNIFSSKFIKRIPYLSTTTLYGAGITDAATRLSYFLRG